MILRNSPLPLPPFPFLRMWQNDDMTGRNDFCHKWNKMDCNLWRLFFRCVCVYMYMMKRVWEMILWNGLDWIVSCWKLKIWIWLEQLLLWMNACSSEYNFKLLKVEYIYIFALDVPNVKLGKRKMSWIFQRVNFH